MTATLLATIAGLAFLDAFNPATIAGVALILVLPGTRPVATAMSFVAGAATIVFAVGVALFLGAGALGSSLSNGLDLIRSIAFTFVAVIIAVSGLRRIRGRTRKKVELPGWFNTRTAFVVGILATGADLPNAFPYFVAIERLVTAQVGVGVGIAVIAGYTLVYCLPCLVLLAVGAARGEQIRGRLQSLYDKYGTERQIPANYWIAGLSVVGAVAVTTWAWT